MAIYTAKSVLESPLYKELTQCYVPWPRIAIKEVLVVTGWQAGGLHSVPGSGFVTIWDLGLKGCR